MSTLSDLGKSLQGHALTVLGHCPLEEGDSLGAGTIVLVGPDEPGFWPHFITSSEYTDGTPNPLDRWSRRVFEMVASDHDATALFPFGGPPYHPFFTWATRSGRFWPSPINFLVHDTAGLFVSFRGALLLPDIISATPTAKPCDTCADQPCATACPVDAFAEGYDVTACKTHIASAKDTDCMALGCRARRACPVGQGKRLPDQAAFHMKAFL